MSNGLNFKRVIRAFQLSLAAVACTVALSFGMAPPSLAAQVQVAPATHLAIFGWGNKTEDKLDRLGTKAKDQLESAGKQISRRAKDDFQDVKEIAKRNSDKNTRMAKEMSQNIKDKVDDAVDTVKNKINN